MEAGVSLPLEGKTAIVTGSSRGIGKMLAIRLAQDGANIVVGARTEQQGDLPGTIGETAQEVNALGREALAVKLDLASDDDIDRVVTRTLDRFGSVDILVNNAVIVGPRQKFVGGNVDFFDLAYRVNVRGPVRLAQQCAAVMASQQGGTIINITSGSARHREAPTKPASDAELDAMDPSYGVTKAALDRFTNAYASELMRDNISIMCVAPGLVITERIKAAAIRPNVDFGRAEPPDVISKAVSFLAQNGMKFTGRVLVAKDLVEENKL
jgi:NAD(P)-dependent dehydrogenase (short-subunit alcohol dehydrogenase family)